METNINIAEILKNKPQGTKLYSPLFGDVYLSYVKNGIINAEHHGGITKFFDNRRYYNYSEAEPLLFPSKEMRDWSKFAWKKGDVLVNRDRTIHIVFEEFIDDAYTRFSGKHYYSKISKNGYEYVRECNCDTEYFTLETEDAAQTYINTIEKGGKLNRETLEIEKQPEFKDGDILCITNESAACNFISIYKKQKGNCIFRYATMFDDNSVVTDKDGYLQGNKLSKRYATDSEKQQLFDALKKKGKAWDAEKKQIVDLPKQHEFKPFDKVLVRDEDDCIWCANIFSHINSHEEYVTIGCERGYTYCLPYEGNEHLLGTTKDVEG